jgi:hypothetical protein
MTNPEKSKKIPENWKKAIYRDPEIPIYRGNPYIEALPPILSEEDAIRALINLPSATNEDDRSKADHVRYHLIYNLNQFFRPLAIHIDLQNRISIMIRAGYLGRNPIHSSQFGLMDQDLENLAVENDRCEISSDKIEEDTLGGNNGPHPATLNRPHQPRHQATGFYIVGVSGVGKSTSIEMILGQYDQVIRHLIFDGVPFPKLQLVWLKIDCPYDGSLGGLCEAFFRAVDEQLHTDYYMRYVQEGNPTITEMLSSMKIVAETHGIGCLVIDEIQDLSEAKGQGHIHMLNFFVSLVNTVGVPVMLIGTPKAYKILTAEFQQARRASGLGDLKWYPMSKDRQWDLLVKALLKYQYVHYPIDNFDEISQSLFDVSAGVTDFAIKAFILAQFYAIDTKVEKITKELIQDVARDKFSFAQTHLDILRNHRYEDIDELPDIQLLDIKDHYLSLINGNSPERFKDLLLKLENEGEESSDGIVSKSSEPLGGVTSSNAKQSGQVVKRVAKPSENDLLKNLSPEDLRHIFYLAKKDNVSIIGLLTAADYRKDPREYTLTRQYK